MRARPARAETTGGALAHRTIEYPFPKPPTPDEPAHRLFLPFPGAIQ